MALKKVDETMEFHWSKNCSEGLKKLQDNVSFAPEYIFLDINMPIMNGLQCLPELKKLDHLRTTRIIMYTTSADDDLKQATRKLGADDYLVKPAKLNVLVEKLSGILEKEI